jgi:TPP-dependent indolepyruvate ferredoxin oxidoreductase alpha subunit
MLPLYSSLNLLEVHHLKNLLEAEGIRCHIKNELLSRLAGEIPFTECAPQLWLLNERDIERARQVVAEFGRGAPARPPWQCPDCGEALEGQFSACWHCGAPRPES